MRRFSIKYVFSEAFKGLWRNGVMTFASIAVLMSCLVMIGCAVLLYFNIDAMLHSIESQNVIMVFVEKRPQLDSI